MHGSWMLFVALGALVGGAAGFFGVGGGIIAVPALVYLFGFSQKEAQGTSLMMMIPPLGLVAVYEYWRQQAIGPKDLGVAAMLVVGFLAGSLVTSSFIGKVSDPVLKKAFAVLLVFVAARMFFDK
ncbi:MAG TPA: sulfite exporter TauE/SafE family protein [Candidatus Saccharimonadales bacterium]|nr:sulfite exporter TauE/SafE family protein [Candidatus Saccharimonadales bacterium]